MNCSWNIGTWANTEDPQEQQFSNFMDRARFSLTVKNRYFSKQFLNKIKINSYLNNRWFVICFTFNSPRCLISLSGFDPDRRVSWCFQSKFFFFCPVLLYLSRSAFKCCIFSVLSLNSLNLRMMQNIFLNSTFRLWRGNSTSTLAYWVAE